MKFACSTKLTVLLLCFTLNGCESISYYSQAILGQLSILSKREDIEALIVDERTPPALKQKLNTILDIRQFATDELLLPVENNYSSYVALERPFVVWNVFATPELSMQALRWCYPIAGCVSYRGYFAEDKARDYAAGLAEQGLDVYVGGVSAYSTLGWFSDPVLSTVINREDYRLAALLFHELAHQLLYIPGDTEFNEGFATAVEREGLRRWLLANEYDEASSREIIAEARLNTQRREEFVNLVGQAVDELQELYASDTDDASKRRRKAEVLATLNVNYRELKSDWGAYDAYDAWMNQELNNAQLSTVATYFNWVPAFEQILAEQENLQGFYRAVQALAELSQDERSRVLETRLGAVASR
ncbi:MAG: aminopeptidase [Gammaproteobacteria bacterium]|nr:aminopeptidase [Gammaproteobacteria bacterium]|tara:strand:+ start:1748 stop:2827 length:1080 start_codon:yes stop_codon:yes gene_type:complete